MADLTSKYRKKELRDISMQACITAIEQASLEFPENYHSGKFTDFFDIEGGTQPPKSKFIYHPTKGYIRFLQIRDFSSENTQTYIPIDPKNKLCNEDDILLGRYGASVGKILTGKVGAYNVACTKVIILNEKIINKEFLFYLLHSTTLQESIKNISRSAQGGFNKGDLSKIDILIPKIEWQFKLIEILKGIDDFLINNSELTFPKFKDEYLKIIIDLLQKRLGVIKEIEELTKELESQKTFLRQLRQAILQEAVQGKLTKQNKDDEPASALLKRIKAEKQKLIASGKLKKEKELPPINENEIPFELPKGWVWCRFYEIAIIRSNLVDPIDYANSIQIGPDVIEKGTGRLLRKRTVKEAEVKSWNHYFFSNQIIYSKIRPNLSKAIIVDFEGLCSADMYPIESLINKQYLLQFILSVPFLNQVVKSDNRVKMPKINQEELNNVIVPLPPLSEQLRIVTKLQQLHEKLGQLEVQIQHSMQYAHQLLQSVLREAFENKVTVCEVEEEVSFAAEN